MNRDSGEGLPEAGRATAAALIERGVEVDVFTAAALDDDDRLRALLQADPALVNERLGAGKRPVDLAGLAGSTAPLSSSARCNQRNRYPVPAYSCRFSRILEVVQPRFDAVGASKRGREHLRNRRRCYRDANGTGKHLKKTAPC